MAPLFLVQIFRSARGRHTVFSPLSGAPATGGRLFQELRLQLGVSLLLGQALKGECMIEVLIDHLLHTGLRGAKPSLIGKRCHLMDDLTDTDQGKLTPQARALVILRHFEQACKDMKGRAVVLSDGKAGGVENLRLDELHGLRVSVTGHEGDWPISTVRFGDKL